MDDAFGHELEDENRVKLSQIASWEHDMLPPESFHYHADGYE